MSEDADATTLTLQLTTIDQCKLLVVDDDPLVRGRLEIVLGMQDFDVASVASGAEALARLEREPFPLLLTDWRMPDMDGLALCAAIRAGRFGGHVYTLLFTILDSDRDLLAGLAAGADDFVSKRASDAELIARLNTGRRIVSLERSLRLANAENRRLGATDVLTNVYNRRHLMRTLPRELARARRYGRPLSVLACDIDHFKSVNDTHGHAVGDEVLQAVALALRNSLRSSADWIARTGGEEFIVVLPEIAPAEAVGVAERLRLRFEEAPLRTSVGPMPVTVSLGVSGIEMPERDRRASPTDLLVLADHQLYKAKAGGRNRVSPAARDPAQTT